jgi:hypothetical protein
MRRWLRNWLLGLNAIASPVETNAHSEPQAPHCRVGVLEVMNGKVLEVCTFKRNNHGSDWTTTYWILNEEKPLAEQIAVVLAMQGLTK